MSEPEGRSRVRSQRARQRRARLNQSLGDGLTISTVGYPKRADFSDLVGKWTADAAFDEVVASQRQIDPDKWK